jgi:hypothetical protein
MHKVSQSSAFGETCRSPCWREWNRISPLSLSHNYWCVGTVGSHQGRFSWGDAALRLAVCCITDLERFLAGILPFLAQKQTQRMSHRLGGWVGLHKAGCSQPGDFPLSWVGGEGLLRPSPRQRCVSSSLARVESRRRRSSRDRSV